MRLTLLLIMHDRKIEEEASMPPGARLECDSNVIAKYRVKWVERSVGLLPGLGVG